MLYNLPPMAVRKKKKSTFKEIFISVLSTIIVTGLWVYNIQIIQSLPFPL